jgi:putative transcriptional regulator
LDVIIENRIAEFRKEQGLSQHRLAKAVDLKRRSIMAYEAGTISPSLESIRLMKFWQSIRES